MKNKPKRIEEGLFELKSLFELSKALSSTLDLQIILSNILLTPMGRMLIKKGVVLLASSGNSGNYVIEEIKGLPQENLNATIFIDNLPDIPFYISEIKEQDNTWFQFASSNNLKIGFPIKSGKKTHGVLVFGEKMSGEDYSKSEIDFLVSLSHLSATSIENSQMICELKEVNKKLDHSNQELNTIFEIGGELSATFDIEKIVKLLGFALMGQMLVNKYALFVLQNGKFVLTGSQGYKGIQNCMDSTAEMTDFLSHLTLPLRIEDNIEDEILKTLQKTGIKLIIPMMIHEKLKGIVCLGEKVSGKRFSEENIEFLSTLGNLAMISLENAMMVEEMLEKQRIEEELALAREIQQNLLPGDFINIPGFQLEAVNISSQSVGGDYYDFLNFADSTCGIVIADVSGKGVPASLLMANVQASFHALSEVMVNPANLIDKINNIIYRNTSSDKFITLFYCRLYPDERRIEYCNAGHNHPFILSKDGTVKYLDKGGLILGIMPDLDYQLDSVDLERGDALIMYTDGVSEAMNKENEEFGENRLLDVCQKLRNNSASTIRDGILNAVNDFSQGAPQYDDITLVVLKVE